MFHNNNTCIWFDKACRTSLRQIFDRWFRCDTSQFCCVKLNLIEFDMAEVQRLNRILKWILKTTLHSGNSEDALKTENERLTSDKWSTINRPPNKEEKMERSVAAWKQFFFLFVNLDLAHSTLIWRVNPPGPYPKGKGLNLKKLRHVIIVKTCAARALILSMADSTKRRKAESQLDVKQVGFIRFFKDDVSTHRCYLNSRSSFWYDADRSVAFTIE